MHIVRLTTSTRLSVILLFIAALLAPILGVSTPAHADSMLRINFQSEGAPVPVSPARYMRDYGLGYGSRTVGEAALAAGAANDPSGFSYGWLVPGTSNPRNMVGQGRGRGIVADRRYDSLMHMQPNTGAAAWEIAIANGFYDVTVAVGEPDSNVNNSEHSIRLEGQMVIDRFTTTAEARSRVTTARVNVTDGRLTIDAEGGTNTKILFVDILPVADPDQPYVAGVSPSDLSVGILRNAGITAEVFVPTGGIRAATINGDTVQLRRASDNALIPASVNTTGGGDAITLQPNDYLDPNTRYIFSVSDGVEAVGGNKFRPFSSSFTTGTGGGPGGGDDVIAFDMVGNVATETQFSSLAIGPDNKLYAASLEGYIYRYNINANGTLSNKQTISTVRGGGRGPRAIIGIAFDPAATADNLILWISHNGEFVLEGAPDWTGAVARLSGPNLENFQDYVVNLPHSFKDHMSNSIAFGPDGKLYISIGSNSAMGHPDNAWGSRPERLLTAAVLRIDQTAISNPPLNAKTEDGGNYNPFAPGAPVTIYATGVRNAYDLVWHSNGELYLPTNGSAQGGNAPPIPNNLPASCANRIDGQPYTNPRNQNGQFGIVAQRDFLYRVEQGGYYGHPNPTRCEWILNGGNPTNGTDPEEVTKYPVGTQPDPNYRGIAYDFDLHKSPNGVIEYQSNAFGGALKGWLIVTRYSQGKDLIALKPGGPNNDIIEARERLQGVNNSFVGNGPLDVIEDTRNGNLYVIQFMINSPSQIALLRPVGDEAPRIRTTAGPFIFTDVATSAGNAGASPSQQVQIDNIGQSPLTINSLSMIGTDAGQFSVNAGGSVPFSIQPGESRTVNVAFTAATPGPKSALLRITSNAANASTLELVLRGLGTAGTGGTNEPSLQWVLDTYEINVNVGDDNAATNIIHSNTATATGPLLGQEIAAQLFQRADNATPVTIEPLAVFGPTGSNPIVRFGWYTRDGAQVTQNQLLQVGNSPASNGQRLAPALESNPTLTFDPGTVSFGFYSTWPFFSNRNVFSEDALNTWETNETRRHKVRIYPLRDSTGAVVENAYIVATEEHTEGFDYQDVVVIVRNVKPAGATPPPANLPPTADAGEDRTVSVGSSVTLNGSGSDPDQGDTPIYSWTQIGGTNVTLTDADTANPSFTAPAAPATLSFRLTVSDGRGGSAQDTVQISVVNSSIVGLTINGPSTRVVGQQATFNASVTSGSNISYSWDFGDGDTATGAGVTHTFEQEGTYVVVVTAQNGGPAITANLAVTVTNAAPAARAGDDIRVPVNAGVTLNGSASSDPDGHSISFSWLQVSGGPVTLSGANMAQATFTAPNQPDTLEFELTVTDAFGKSSTDRVQVIVESEDRANTAPVANAGADVRVATGSTVKLHGGASFDPDGDALSYAWSQVSGPVVSSAAVLSAVAMDDIALTFTAPSAPATLVFEITVTDAYGKSAADHVLVLVEAANRPNTAPTANAGSDLRVPVSGEVTLDASASSDPESDLISFSWTQVSGPTVALNGSGAQARFFAPNSPATLRFEVTVTDAFGASATDQVIVRVVAATSANTPPTANAGPDQRMPVSTPVTLDARGSNDQDGDVLMYTWQQVSGPSVVLSNANRAVAQFGAPATAGTLVFEVTVTDAFGGNNSDRVTVTVGPVTGNRAPVANAGPTRSAPLNANVRLDASASSDPDGDALRYSWRQLEDGPRVTLVGAHTARPAFITTPNAATFVFEVTVTDAFGASNTAQVTIRTPGPAQDAFKIYLPIVRR